ncbi:MAG: hypothetical protein Q8W45_08545 [Candidatus Palauibacterales bacterium]|jgi:hypothetical protein|nr:hypothetical protein [Candidatus Palauibacterales bacterium]MDP2483315.1 hypothetical protein [Candidatus Palauibacterales bacterium]
MTRLQTARGGSRGPGRPPPAIRLLFVCAAYAALFPPVSPAQESGLDPAARANPNDRLDATAWSIMASKGWSNYQTLGRTVRFIFDYAGEDVYALDVAYTISPETGFGGFFDRHLAARFQVAGKLSARAQESRDWIPEFSAYFALRWRRLPWNHVVATSLAIGEGLSIVGAIPEVEILTTERGGTNNLLNYLMLEATFALPSQPRVQLVSRIDHRSGMFGVFNDAVESGSNTVALGIRVNW